MVSFQNSKCESCGKELEGVIYDYGDTWACEKCELSRITKNLNSSVLYGVMGDKVLVTSDTAENGYDSDSEKVKNILEIGKEYTINSLHIGRSSSAITLKEFPDEIFNTVNFIRI